MEKIVVGVETCNRADTRIARRLLVPMLEKNIPGFCTELKEACDILGVEFDQLLEKSEIRPYLKEKVIEIQRKQLLNQMILSSKMDKVLLQGFNFNGKVMKHLQELEFGEARAVFMTRYRMLPTKANFPGRWSGKLCNACGFMDVDEHIFHCPGYKDIVAGKEVSLEMFWDPEILDDMSKLSEIGGVMKLVIERMEYIQSMKT